MKTRRHSRYLLNQYRICCAHGEDVLRYLVGDQARAAKDVTALDALAGRVSYGSLGLLVIRQDQRRLQRVGQRAAGEAIREVLSVGKHRRGGIEEELLRNQNGGIVTGVACQTLDRAVGLQLALNRSADGGSAAHDDLLSGSSLQECLLGIGQTALHQQDG